MRCPGARCHVQIQRSQALALAALTLLTLLQLHALLFNPTAVVPHAGPSDGVAVAAQTPASTDDSVDAPADAADNLVHLALAAVLAVLLPAASWLAAPTRIRRLVGTLMCPISPPPRPVGR